MTPAKSQTRQRCKFVYLVGCPILAGCPSLGSVVVAVPRLDLAVAADPSLI